MLRSPYVGQAGLRLARRQRVHWRRVRWVCTWLVVVFVVAGVAGLHQAAARRSDPIASTSSAAGSGVLAGARADPPAAGSNLFVGNKASFVSSTGGWVGVRAAVSWVAGPSDSGRGALELRPTTRKSASAWSGGGPGSDTPASAPLVYEASATVEAAGAPVTAQALLAFYSRTGRYLTALWSQGTSLQPGIWTALPGAVGIAPPGTAWTRLGIVMYSTSTAERLFVDKASLLSAAAGAPPVVGPLNVSGTHIVDAAGKPVDLRGLTIYGLEESPDPPSLSRSEVLAAKAWGANIIRVPLGEQLWLSSSCQYDPKYAAAVTKMVGWITSLGMVALLDLHFNAVTHCGKAGQQPMADYPGSIEFWKQVAARFGSNPLVAFDLYNEPHGLTTAQWLDGGTVHVPPTPPFDAAGMQQLYDAVRSTGARNVIFVSGNSWANVFPGALVKGYNIVYAVNTYTCPWIAPPQCGFPRPYEARFLPQWAADATQVPVIVGEFGWPSPYSGTFNSNVIDFAQAQGWGWIAFAWDGTTSGRFDLLSQMIPGGPYEPAPAGMPVLAALAGLP